MSELAASHPGAWGDEVGRWTLDAAPQLRELRQSLYRTIGGQKVDGELDGIPDRMVLVATELATNALRHSLPPTIIRLHRTDECFILDVADQDPTILPEFAETRPPGAGGLGLRLAQSFALDIGWYVAGNTKHIWAEFPLSEHAAVQ